MTKELLISFDEPFECEECKYKITSIDTAKIQLVSKINILFNAYGTFCPKCNNAMVILRPTMDFIQSEVDRFIELGTVN